MANLAKVKLSVLELAPVRDKGTTAEALHNALALAKHVEELGYARFWVAEHHNMDGIASSAVAVLLGYLAAGTTSIRLGSGGIMLPNHAPLVIAEQFGTLETLYPGRIDLGLGRAPGTDQYTAHALRRARSGSAEDFPQDVAELQHYLNDAQQGQRVVATPGNGTKVPLWLLGSSLFSAQLAAEQGLPYAFASHFAPRFMQQAITLYRENFKPSAQLAKPYVMLGIPLIAADTDEQADYLVTTSYQRILSLVRGDSLKMKPPVPSMAGLWLPHEQQAVANFFAMAVVGGPEKIKAKLKAIVSETQADELIFTCDLYDVSDRLRSFELAMQAKLAN